MKKILSIVLSALMVMILFGCKNGIDSNTLAIFEGSMTNSSTSATERYIFNKDATVAIVNKASLIYAEAAAEDILDEGEEPVKGVKGVRLVVEGEIKVIGTYDGNPLEDGTVYVETTYGLNSNLSQATSFHGALKAETGREVLLLAKKYGKKGRDGYYVMKEIITNKKCTRIDFTTPVDNSYDIVDGQFNDGSFDLTRKYPSDSSEK